MDQRINWSLVLLAFILASHIADVLSKHHHIKLRHGRHRRQHGESYLPASFVLDTEDEETGNWGPWSAPGSCSRSCGGGVAYQTRNCYEVDNSTGSDLCTGSKKRFFSCNVQDCPEPATDFRAEQCAEFNNVSMEGVHYDWIPYTGGANKCELNCMPRGDRFFFRHKLSVTDGTRCTSERNDVCVQGKCRPVGCDMMLGSDTREDKCRECGGDGSACNTINGLSDLNDLPIGYNDLLLIPAGATNIAISEVRPSNNYLAIRNATGHYYLNGNWRIDFPRSLRFAGSVFNYERRPKGFYAAELINTLGPTNEALYIVLLSQETNVGVNYEYSIPKRFSSQSSQDSYTWVAEEFSDCSSTCGGGIKSRLVRCVRRGDNSDADENLCDQALEPAGTQACGAEPCAPNWVVLDWSPCSKQCGGGEQTRQIKCEQIISGGIPSIVDDYRCLEFVGPKDIEVRECNKNVECPKWHVGPWKPCDRLCGKGKETRKITCFSKVNGKISVRPDSVCQDERPESEKDCELRPCAGVDWVVSQWSGCDDKCGLTQETRTTICMTLAGEAYPDEQCDPEKKPKLSRECSAQERCSFQWYSTQWSECSAKCGTGIQTRKVFCGTSPLGGETITKVGDDRCDPAKKYNDTKSCAAEVEECKGEWFAGPWSECSKPCGGGDATRKVICMRDNRVVPNEENCYEESIMAESETCNEKPCEEVETIPVEIGKPGAPTDGEEECEDYQDDEFVSVDLDLEIDSSLFGPPFENKFSGRGLDDLMMGDAPGVDGSGDADSLNEFISQTDGSGWWTGSTDSDGTESTGTTDDYGTGSTDFTESTEPASTADESAATKVSSSDTSAEPKLTTPVRPQFYPVRFEQPSVDKPNFDDDDYTDPTEVSDVTNDYTTESGSTSIDDTSNTSPGFEETAPTSDSSTYFGSDTTEPSTAETTTSGWSDATSSSSLVPSASPSSVVEESSGTETTAFSSTGFGSTQSSSVGVTESSTYGSSKSSSVGVTDASTSDATTSSSAEVSGSTDLDSTESSSVGVTETSTSGSTSSSEAGVTETVTSDSTVSSSTGVSGSTDVSSTQSSSVGVTESSTDGSSRSSSVGVTDASTSDATTSSSAETSSSTDVGSTQSSSVGVTDASTPDSTTSSSSATSGSTDVESTQSSSVGVTETSTSDSTQSSSFGDTETTSSESTVSSSVGVTDASTSDSTTSSSGGDTETTASGSTISSSVGVTETSSSGLTESSSVGVTEISTSDSTQSSSVGVTDASTSDSTQSSSVGVTETSTSGSTQSSSVGDTEATTSGSTISSSVGVTETSTSDSTQSSSIGVTDSSTSDSTQSSSVGITEISTSDSTISSSVGVTDSSTSDSTQSSSVGVTESSTSGSTTSSSDSSDVGSTTESSTIAESSSTAASSSETTGSSTGSTEFGASTDVTGSESTGSTETSESGSTVTIGETDVTTASGVTDETTVSGITETDEDISSTDQSHITDIWSTISPLTNVLKSEQRLPKCKPRKRKQSCKTSRFGCCYDGRKAATGPFGKGCPIPKTCKETEFGCCPDEVSPAAGANNEGCPESHCGETLFGCCPDKVTPAEGNDNEGCPVPCSEAEFGCCPDEKTPASGKDNLGCCNVTEHGCCPDGIKPAAGPEGEGCAEETTSVVASIGLELETTTETSETEAETTTSETEAETPTSEDHASTIGEAESTTTETSCAVSEFGCCPDGRTPATGQNLEGCGVIDTENCTASYYGCCPDGVSAALGPNNRGCHVECENSAFGCCYDGLTPAHGPNAEGCCSLSPYGCCPDNIQRAQGPNLYGCGCQYSRYGCCPDNQTHASGYNNEGCACQYTLHGCCPNQIATASGPGFEGCPCHSYQFGCCPDGVTVAIGPQQQGCGCENTEFKCCSDGVTPAKGENYAGCTCDASKFGCCSDGVEEAQGENFEGCLTVPTRIGAACGLHSDRGICSNYTVKWFFDTTYGGCSRFWYGGCGGNDNKFKSSEECKEVCVEPKGRDACYLPKIAGPCQGYDRKWYYDSERKQCGEFIYSGCLGNANKFESRDDCEELCVLPDEVDACEQTKEVGPCEGNFTRWYYNKESSSCEEFNYGGCKANKNNFRTQISCEQKCLTPGKSRDSCSLQRAEGTCTKKYARWFFDESENRCMPFYYTGCGGNRNNYQTKDACDNDCPPKIEQNICYLPALLGECHDYTQRWYYDVRDQRCRQFYYGGCGGNGNNFETENECENRCEPSRPQVVPVAPEFQIQFCFLSDETGPCDRNLVKFFYDSREGVCKQFTYGGCGGNGNKFDTIEECENRCGNTQDLCTLPPVVGPCRALLVKYYYDHNTDSCNEFEYGGCQGNKNNFDNIATCERSCKKSFENVTTTVKTTTLEVTTTVTPAPSRPKSPICYAPMDAGPCQNDVTAYYYDSSRGVCQAFIYGGCEGNANRFQTEEQCERLCGTFEGQDVCNLRADPGPCTEDKYPKYYYDPDVRQCRRFIYGGCDGNANRFTSEDECESVCIHREEPVVPGNQTSKSSIEICKEPVSVGSCSVGSYKRFYYDDEHQTCLAFIYTGCGGNRNRFKTFGACIKACSTPSNEIDVGPPAPGPKDPCLPMRAECDALRCPYGKKEYLDEQLCPHCRCADLCSDVTCPEGTRCAITLVAREDSTEYQSICRAILKPGSCPHVSNATSCEVECSSDADCTDDRKCCSNGCGSSCLEPASEHPSPTIPPFVDVTAVPYPDEKPAIIEPPEEPNVRAEEGSFVILKCVATGNPRPFITWRKGVTLIDESVSRYSVNVDGSLQIVGLYRTDAGIYTCTADNRVTVPVRIQYQLDITDPHNHISAILGAPNYHVTVTLNSPTVLQCYAVGWPRPMISWWHEGRMLPLSNEVYEQQRDHSLRIHRVSLINLGVYTCQAYNGIRRPASWSLTLQAPGPVHNVNDENRKYTKYLVDPPKRPSVPDLGSQHPHEKAPSTESPQVQTYAPLYRPGEPHVPPVNPRPDPSPEIVPKKYTVPVKVNVSADSGSFTIGSTFAIGCDVDGYPFPRVLWYKNDNVIIPDDRITISESNRLHISEAQKSDSGRYRCQAANEYTSHSDSVDIEVAGVYVDPNCQDNPFFAKCELIVKGNYCKHAYYKTFCCRSCTEAGQLSARGSQHINDTRRKRRSIIYSS